MDAAMDGNTNRTTVLAFLNAFYSGDAPTAQACCADDYNSITYAPIEIFPHLGHKQGRDWLPEAIRIQEGRYQRRRCDVAWIAVDGDKVAATLRIALQKRNDDRTVQFESAEFMTLRDGLIFQQRSFFDSFDLIQQLLGHDLTDTFAASMRGAMAP